MISVPSRRSYSALPAKGRPGPSDDDLDDDDHELTQFMVIFMMMMVMMMIVMIMMVMMMTMMISCPKMYGMQSVKNNIFAIFGNRYNEIEQISEEFCS